LSEVGRKKKELEKALELVRWEFVENSNRTRAGDWLGSERKTDS